LLDAQAIALIGSQTRHQRFAPAIGPRHFLVFRVDTDVGEAGNFHHRKAVVDPPAGKEGSSQQSHTTAGIGADAGFTVDPGTFELPATVLILVVHTATALTAISHSALQAVAKALAHWQAALYLGGAIAPRSAVTQAKAR